MPCVWDRVRGDGFDAAGGLRGGMRGLEGDTWRGVGARGEGGSAFFVQEDYAGGASGRCRGVVLRGFWTLLLRCGGFPNYSLWSSRSWVPAMTSFSDASIMLSMVMAFLKEVTPPTWVRSPQCSRISALGVMGWNGGDLSAFSSN